MIVVRSPLGAIGAIVVLLQGISAGALLALRSQPVLQWVLVIMMVSMTTVITGVVVWMVVRFARSNPALLFPAQDIDPSVQRLIYAPPGHVEIRTLLEQNAEEEKERR